MNANPDIYTEPFNSLNFNLNKKINSHFSLGISLRNILNQNKSMTTDSYVLKKRYIDHIILGDFLCLRLIIKFKDSLTFC